MGEQDQIQTNVDKLVSLVQEYGKITFKDAAKKLALPVETIEQWAHILESENVIELKFGFGSPTIIKKDLSDKFVKERVLEFKQEKDLFSKKLESAESYFNELDKKINNVVDIMRDMEGNVDKKLSHVNEELTELQIAEDKKEALDRRILESKQLSQKKLQEVEDHIRKLKESFESSYAQTRKDLAADEEMFAKSQEFLDKVKSQELELQKRLNEIKTMSVTIKDDVESRAKKIEENQIHILNMRKKHDELKAQLEEEHENLKDLLEENEQQEKEVAQLQKNLFDKMSKEEADLSSTESDIRQFPQRFKELVAHKNDIHELLNVIGHEEIELRKEIDELRRLSNDLASGVENTKYLQELEKLSNRMNAITSKRSFFKTKIEQLVNMLDWTSRKGKQSAPLNPPNIAVPNFISQTATSATQSTRPSQPLVTHAATARLASASISQNGPVSQLNTSQSSTQKRSGSISSRAPVKGNAKKGKNSSKGSKSRK